MALEFKFPDVGEGIHEGTLVKWLVKEGDHVKADQNIAEVETDKAVVEIPSPREGYILKRFHEEGQIIIVGEVLAVIGDKGEHYTEKIEEKAHYTGSVVGFVPTEETDLDAQRKKKKEVSQEQVNGVMATPLVRKLAKDLGVDIALLQGTGPKGNITEDDVKNAARKPSKKIEVHGPVERIPLKGIRKVTADHMKDAHQNAALVTNHDDIDVTELMAVRKKFKEEAAKKGIAFSYMPLIIKAVIEGLKNHPRIASSLDGNELILKKYYHIGIAVDTPDGLLVPVIRDADKKDMMQLASEIQHFAEKAKSRHINIHDLHGGTITITNLGAIGGTYFTPIINYPESCIIGLGRIEDKVVVRDGKIAIRKIMPISFTYDHQVVDGADSARFVNDVKAMLERPTSLH